MRTIRRVVVLVLIASALAVAFASAADAGTPSRKAKPVPTCSSLGRVHGVQAWMDLRQGMRSPLYRGLDRMICSAADRSRIEIKSWFVGGVGPATAQLAAHLRLMHRYHHVSVTILVGRNGYGSASSWRAFVNRFTSFSTIRSCAHQCVGPSTPDGKSHSKFVTVSRLRTGGSAVLSTSANPTDQQFGTVESGVFVAGDQGLYNAFHGEFGAMIARSPNVKAAMWAPHANGVASYFSPVATTVNPDRDELARVDCSHGGLVEASSLKFGSSVAAELGRMHTRGCTVRVIVEHRSPTLTGKPVQRRCALTHDKSIVIDTPKLREVIAGSEDFAWGALHSNDQQMLRVRASSVVSAFERQFAAVWAHPATCLA